MTDKPARPKPPPLTPMQRSLAIASLVAGLIVVMVALFFLPDTLPDLAMGAIVGAGSGLLAIGLITLFYRPDRGPGVGKG